MFKISVKIFNKSIAFYQKSSFEVYQVPDTRGTQSNGIAKFMMQKFLPALFRVTRNVAKDPIQSNLM